MSIEGKTPADGGTPASITRFDGIRVPATDYGHPVWLDNLADDVTIEGSAIDGSVMRGEYFFVETLARALSP